MGKHTHFCLGTELRSNYRPRTLLMRKQMILVLLELAKEGGLNGLTITSKELGQLLGVAQQSASRYLVALEKDELIHRTVMAFGQKITITTKGNQLLQDLHFELTKVLGTSFAEITLKGEIVSGLGEGRYYISLPGYYTQIEEKLGFKPFLGTLNVKLATFSDFQKFQQLRSVPAIQLEPFSADGRTYGYVDCYIVTINDKVEGAIVRSERTHHGENFIEIISPINLREHLALQDGSSVTVRYVGEIKNHLKKSRN